MMGQATVYLCTYIYIHTAHNIMIYVYTHAMYTCIYIYIYTCVYVHTTQALNGCMKPRFGFDSHETVKESVLKQGIFLQNWQ